MKKISLLILAGALASCQQQSTGEDTNAENTAVPSTQTSAFQHNSEVDGKVMAALDTCQQVEPGCGGSPAGYLVFPDVTSVAFGVGGAGGEGALVENGQITGYYKMGQGSVGLEAGVTAASYVLQITDPATLEQYKTDGEWSIGADAGVTVAQAGATAQSQTAGENAILYVFNSEGLMGDASVNAMKIWRTNDLNEGAPSTDTAMTGGGDTSN